MDGFEDITLRWEGQTYTVPADRAFELVRILETTIMGGGNVPAVMLLLNRQAPYSTIASAYAQALQFAGCKVPAGKVYMAMMQGFADEVAGTGEEGETAEFVAQTCLGLLGIIAPPLAVQALEPSAKQ